VSKFTLSIELGNVAMATTEMVADALRAVADRVDGAGHGAQDAGIIHDANGNTVGEWEFEEDADDEEDYEGYQMSDAEADADALASAGHGTDEDYGYFGDPE
jgi:hypothetical protein